MVTCRLQVERITGAVRRPMTAVLPLCYATNQSLSDLKPCLAEKLCFLSSNWSDSQSKVSIEYRGTPKIPYRVWKSAINPALILRLIYKLRDTSFAVGVVGRHFRTVLDLLPFSTARRVRIFPFPASLLVARSNSGHLFGHVTVYTNYASR